MGFGIGKLLHFSISGLETLLSLDIQFSRSLEIIASLVQATGFGSFSQPRYFGKLTWAICMMTFTAKSMFKL